MFIELETEAGERALVKVSAIAALTTKVLLTDYGQEELTVIHLATRTIPVKGSMVEIERLMGIDLVTKKSAWKDEMEAVNLLVAKGARLALKEAASECLHLDQTPSEFVDFGADSTNDYLEEMIEEAKATPDEIAQARIDAAAWKRAEQSFLPRR